MTRVTFQISPDHSIRSVDILGHADYAETGEDIVCAAITSAVMLTHALLFDVQRIPVDTLVEDDGAHIRITLPEGEGKIRGQDGLRALRMHLTELTESYSEFLSVMEVQE